MSSLPYYTFYPGEFMLSSTVQCMCLVAEGIYRRLLDFQWLEGALDDDVLVLKRLARASDEQWECFAPFLDRCFPLCDDGKRRNPRMAQTKEEADRKTYVNAANGAKGGRPRSVANRTETENEPEPNRSVTENEPNENRTETELKPTANRPETERKPIANRSLTDRKGNRDKEIEREIKLVSNDLQVCVGRGSGGGCDHPPPAHIEPRCRRWWVDDPDSWEFELVETIRSAKNYGDFHPDEEKVRALCDMAREFAPDRQAFSLTLESFVNRDSKRRTAEYKNPVLALSNWFKNSEARWRAIKRERAIDQRFAARQKSESPIELARRLTANLLGGAS
jgi:uncharacterized protein YdaU (DUF1376 family)